MSELLDFTIYLSRAGGQVLRERFLQPRQIYAKGPNDYTTDADLAAQQTIVDLIRSRDPHAVILAEEAGLASSAAAASLWVVDPLDGTTNYAHRFPSFSVSIAYVEQGRPIAGVVYDPLNERLFAAERDRGATLNGGPIRVSTTVDIAAGVIGLDWGRGAAQRARALDWLGQTGRQCRSIRALGSAALGLCSLAAGWIDVYLHPSLQPWDGAAGQIIAEEAGAQLFDFAHQPWNYDVATCIGSTPLLTDWALNSLG